MGPPISASSEIARDGNGPVEVALERDFEHLRVVFGIYASECDARGAVCSQVPAEGLFRDKAVVVELAYEERPFKVLWSRGKSHYALEVAWIIFIHVQDPKKLGVIVLNHRV